MNECQVFLGNCVGGPLEASHLEISFGGREGSDACAWPPKKEAPLEIRVEVGEEVVGSLLRLFDAAEENAKAFRQFKWAAYRQRRRGKNKSWAAGGPEPLMEEANER